MKKRLTAAVMCSVLMLTLFSACGTKAENLTSDITPAADLPGAETASLNAANDFAVSVLTKCAAEGGNVLVSPLSIVSALAMTANGAKGNTLSRMEKVMGMSRDDLNRCIKKYTAALPHEENCAVSLANSVWFNNAQRFTVNQDFLQAAADWYGADAFSAPFDNSTVRDINRWCSDSTDGMIDELLKEIPVSAVMYLINALAFDAKWSVPYEPQSVTEGKFTNLDGSRSDAEYMHSEEYTYLSDGSTVGFMKSYCGGSYAFAALLPKEGMSPADYAATLRGDKLRSILENADSCAVSAVLPKFEFDYGTDLKDALCALGMGTAFDPYKADLSGLGSSEAGNLFISAVIHKTFISVDTEGTKAAAVTSVEVRDCAAFMPDELKYVTLDRPFVFMIVDTENQVPIFMGIVNEL